MRYILTGMIAVLGGITAVPASAVGFSGLFLNTNSTAGAVLTVNGVNIMASQSGWFDSSGQHVSGNVNYGVGSIDGTVDHNDYFTFAVAGGATSASLSLAQPTNGSRFGPGVTAVTYTLYDFSTLSASATITTSGYTGRTDVFDDLGSGVSYGSVTVSGSTPTVTITFNQAGLDAINAAADGGGSFGVGGALTEGSVPEPAAWALMIVGFGVVGTALRRQRTAVMA